MESHLRWVGGRACVGAVGGKGGGQGCRGLGCWAAGSLWRALPGLSGRLPGQTHCLCRVTHSAAPVAQFPPPSAPPRPACSNTSAKFYGEITQQMLKNSSFPGSNNGTGLFQTIVGLKVRPGACRQWWRSGSGGGQPAAVYACACRRPEAAARQPARHPARQSGCVHPSLPTPVLMTSDVTMRPTCPLAALCRCARCTSASPRRRWSPSKQPAQPIG